MSTPAPIVATCPKCGNPNGQLDEPTLIKDVDTFICAACGFVWTAKRTPDVDEISQRLDRIQELADELAKCPADLFDQMNVAARLRQEVIAAKAALKRQP